MTNQNTYKIDRNIPMPYVKSISRTARIRNTLARLEVGNSFAIGRRDWGNASNPRYVVPYREARDAGIKIITQISIGAIRIWRIK
jgi:hypothetical protein